MRNEKAATGLPSDDRHTNNETPIKEHMKMSEPQPNRATPVVATVEIEALARPEWATETLVSLESGAHSGKHDVITIEHCTPPTSRNIARIIQRGRLVDGVLTVFAPFAEVSMESWEEHDLQAMEEIADEVASFRDQLRDINAELARTNRGEVTA